MGLDAEGVGSACHGDLKRRHESRRGQPLVDLSRNVDLPGFAQELRAADTRGHPFGLLAKVECFLGQAILECR